MLPSLFQEQIEHETSEIDRLYSVHHHSSGEASSFFPELDGYNTGADAYLALIEAARDRVDVPVIASLNGTNIGGWLRYARLLEDAGADAMELSLYAIGADPAISGAALEAEQLELVALVTDEVSIPVAVKISPYYTSVAAFALGLQDAGASGIVMFNRFYLPDLDLDTLDVEPRISLSNQAELRLPLRWIGIVRDYLSISIAGSTGVHTGQRRRQAPARRRRRRDDDLGVAPSRRRATSPASPTSCASGCASTTTTASTRCAAPSVARRRPTPTPTNAPTTSATSPRTPAASSAPRRSPSDAPDPDQS